jgi:hypothetical protein
MNFALFLMTNWIAIGFQDAFFPNVSKNLFWTHCYRLVANDTEKKNDSIRVGISRLPLEHITYIKPF